MIHFIQKMKTIDAHTIIDFLRRILESNNLDKVDIRYSEMFSSFICYRFTDKRYVMFYIFESYINITSGYFDKNINFTESERVELMFYFNKILAKKEDELFNTIDKACRYTDTEDFI